MGKGSASPFSATTSAGICAPPAGAANATEDSVIAVIRTGTGEHHDRHTTQLFPAFEMKILC